MKHWIPALSLCLFGASCVAPGGMFMPRYGPLDVSGSILANDDMVSASTTTESLGLNDSADVFSPRLDLTWLGSRLSLATFDASYAGDGVTEAEINFEGTTITAATPVHTDLDLAVHSGSFIWDLAPGETVEAGLGFGIAVMELDATIMELGGGMSTTTTSQTVPIPLAKGRLAGKFGKFTASGDLGLFSITVDDVDASFTDLDLALLYELGSPGGLHGHVGAGYRLVQFDASYTEATSDIAFDMEFSGPYVAFVLSF